MKLESIHVVQWFLYEQQTVRLDEITGFFGPNASGKSSFLDAVQVAVFGANSKLVSLNAQADEHSKSSRTIRGYCLGQYGELPEHRVRANAQTYVSLVWRDPQTGRPMTVGVALAASSDTEKLEVLGRYIADGVEVSLTDHLTSHGDQQRPRDWKMFRGELTRRVERVSGRTDELFYESAEKYIKALLTAMSRGKDMASMELFKRAFRFSLRLRYDKSVDEIIRQEVLEARPTNIRVFMEVTATFRHLRQLVEGVKKQLVAGEEIDRAYVDADKQHQRMGAWQILAEDVEAACAAEAAARATQAKEVAAEAAKTAANAALEARKHLGNLRAERDRLVERRDGHDAHSRLAPLQGHIDRDHREIQVVRGHMQARLTELDATLRFAAGAPFLAEFFGPLDQAAANLGGCETLDPTARRGRLDVAVQWVNKVRGKAMNTLREHLQAQTRVEKDIEDAQRNRARAREGKAPLPLAVTRLLDLLHDHGIDATPVCDLVRVSEPRWQPAIEALLGDSNTTALIIPREDESRAFSLYREQGKAVGLYGVKLVLPSRIKLRTVQAGTVGALFTGDSSDALAYLRLLVGSTRQAESNTDALSGGRALTPDGMFVNEHVVDRLRLPFDADLRLGARPAGNMAMLNAQLRQLEEERNTLESEISRVREMQDLLARVPTTDALDADFTADLERIEKLNLDIKSRQVALANPSDEDYRTLCDQLSVLSTSIRDAETRKDAAAREEVSREEKWKTARDCTVEAIRVADMMRVRAEEVRGATLHDPAYAAERWDELIKTNPNSFADQKTHCLTQADKRRRESEAAVRKGALLFVEFVRDYPAAPGTEVMSEWRQAWQWLSEQLARLHSTTLAKYEAEMRDAERTSQDTFRTDVAVKLSENLSWLDQQRRRLNDVLNRCPAFSNGERYQFRQNVRPEHEELLRFIRNVADKGPNEDLFGGPGELPGQFLELLDEYTNPQGKAPRTPLDDYREFFSFDIEIRQETRDGPSRLVGHLSKRVGQGSGGEHQSPLYVIAGAALASAYGVDSGHRDGMRLIVLDEAFERMDPTNIVATMRYLEDLGLQVLLASPGANLPTLTAFLHRYYQILRDANLNTVMLEGRDLNQKDRDLMRSDLLEFNPHLLDAERDLMAQERIGAAP